MSTAPNHVPISAVGFEHPVDDAQSTFRSAMRALAEPGTLHRIDRAPVPPGLLSPVTAALLLALADYETPIWLDQTGRDEPGLADFLRFQTGAPIVADPARAGFGVITDPTRFASLDVFAQGTLEYPDRSTTLIVQVERLEPDGRYRLSGPGIAGERRLGIEPPVPGLAEALSVNHERFPRGVDVILVAGDTIAGLPRSTRVVEGAA